MVELQFSILQGHFNKFVTKNYSQSDAFEITV